MERIGDFVVLSYHDVRDAASLHEHFKKRSISAAVIDSAYIMSRLHLVVALHRISSAPLIIGHDDCQSKMTRKSTARTARDVFAALSHTRNLYRVLEHLTCSETTRAVVIVLSAPTEEDIAAVLDIVQGVRHGLLSLEEYRDEAAVRDFYGVGESEAAALEVTIVNRLATSDI
ncbi:hypothetical protein TcG_08206 [Trypanosoma cruzi]|nr:hypothetical protein TcG_08206 [Trypanosoma cruzi]